MTASRSRFLFAGAVVLSWSVVGIAGEPTAADRETARELMKQGRAARDANDLKGALKNFEAADAIMHVPTTGYEVAKTRAMMGMLIEARDLALTVARSPARPDDPPPFAEARAAARRLESELEGRIPSIKIGAPADAQVTIDGVKLPAALIGLPRKVNPGRHTIVVKSGARERSLEVEILERESRELNVNLDAPQPPKTAATPLDVKAPESSTSAGKALPMVLTISGLGVAAAGAVIGSITGAMSISQTNTIKTECGGIVCPPSRKGEIDSANTLALVSTISFVAAGVGAAVGAVGVVVVATKKPTTQAATFVRGYVGFSSIGIEGTF